MPLCQGDGMLLEHGLRDLGDGEGLEDVPVRCQLQACQAGLDDGRVACAAVAGVALHEGGDGAVHEAHGHAALPEGQAGALVEHVREVDGRVGAR